VSNALINLTPVYVGIVLGYILRQTKVVDSNAPATILRIGFYIVAPAVIFESTINSDTTDALIAYPIFSLFAGLVGYLVGKFVITKHDFGSLRNPLVILACMVVNTTFTLLFVTAQYGANGSVRVIVFNAVNLPIAYLFGHAIAARSNPEAAQEKSVAKKLLVSPPLWALILGAIVKPIKIDFPVAFDTTLNAFAISFIPLAALAIGMSITLKANDLRDSFIAIGLRYITSLIIGIAIIFIFGFEGMDRAIVLTLSLAPVGFTTLTFAHLEKLDEEYAAKTLGISFVSSTILVSIVMAVAG